MTLMCSSTVALVQSGANRFTRMPLNRFGAHRLMPMARRRGVMRMRTIVADASGCLDSFVARRQSLPLRGGRLGRGGHLDRGTKTVDQRRGGATDQARERAIRVGEQARPNAGVDRRH